MRKASLPSARPVGFSGLAASEAVRRQRQGGADKAHPTRIARVAGPKFPPPLRSC
jgi:hypothetical protein